MKAVTWHGRRDVRVDTVPDPAIEKPTDMIIRLTNSKSGIVFKPHPGPEVDLRVPSIEKAQALLGYQPKISLEGGISRTIPWYAEHLSVTQR